MTLVNLPDVDTVLRPVPLILGLTFGLGAYLLVTGQPIGRPKPDLAERLRRLDADERIELELRRSEVRPFFHSRLLEAVLRPVLDDLGRLVRLILSRLGLAGGVELERKLRVARPGVEPSQFFGEKVAAALIGLVIFPFMNALGVHPFGLWPVWSWLVGATIGFLGPDWQLERHLSARRTECLMELPIILDMLTIATSAGLALEQALDQVIRQGAGTVARELQHARRDMTLRGQTLIDSLEEMSGRVGVPELTSFTSQLRAAHEQGIPLTHTLTAQAEALRERKRLRIVEEGGKASVRMLLPVALFVMPVLFVVLLVPAAVELMRLGG
jgi:tight adherence protein C